ncbi:hypothetical protein E4T39_02736 [Aureobasidium subglaciale]|nr:hypothetical protein E4T39_02736 [Aureobasidium subglaciale]
MGLIHKIEEKVLHHGDKNHQQHINKAMANKDMVNLKAAMELVVWAWAAVVRSLAHIILVATLVDPSSRVGSLDHKAVWADLRAGLQEVWEWAVVEAQVVPVVLVAMEVLVAVEVPVAGRMTTDPGPPLDTTLLLTTLTHSV